jgi:excisionase family DNA binding protein
MTLIDCEPIKLTTHEVAPLFRVHRSTIARWCEEGIKFPNAIRAGRSWLIPETDVRHLLTPARSA